MTTDETSPLVGHSESHEGWPRGASGPRSERDLRVRYYRLARASGAGRVKSMRAAFRVARSDWTRVQTQKDPSQSTSHNVEEGR